MPLFPTEETLQTVILTIMTNQNGGMKENGFGNNDQLSYTPCPANEIIVNSSCWSYCPFVFFFLNPNLSFKSTLRIKALVNQILPIPTLNDVQKKNFPLCILSLYLHRTLYILPWPPCTFSMRSIELLIKVYLGKMQQSVVVFIYWHGESRIIKKRCCHNY